MANTVVERIRAIARRRRESPAEVKAAYETGRVESNFQNLPGGDADSQGWRQERKSLYANPRDLDASINRFFDETSQAQKANPGAKSYELAAAVQRPAAQYRGRYKDVSKEAQSLLKGGGSTGGKSPARGSSPRTADTGTGAADARRAALQAYVLSQGTQDEPDSALALAQGLAAARKVKDTPDAKTAIKQRRSSKPSSGGESLHGSGVKELIFNDGGKGYGIKDGKEVDGAGTFSAVWAGHANHVHVAAGPKTVVELGKLAQKHGLHVGENSHFGGVDRGAHTENSYHYKDEAIDVSGDPKKMAAFAREVAEYNKSRKL